MNSDDEFTDSEREEIINKINLDYEIACEDSLIIFHKDGTGIYDSSGYCQECEFYCKLIDNEMFKWDVRASFNYCTLKSYGTEPELIWEWTTRSTYNGNGGIIGYTYSLIWFLDNGLQQRIQAIASICNRTKIKLRINK